MPGQSFNTFQAMAGTTPKASARTTIPGNSHDPPKDKSAVANAVSGKVNDPQSGENPVAVIQMAPVSSARKITMPRAAKPKASVGWPTSPDTIENSAAGAR